MFKQFFSALEILEETKSSQRVFDYVEGLDEFDRDSTFKMVAKYFARAGRTDEALSFGAAIRGPKQRIHGSAEIARELKRKGYTDLAKTLLQQALTEANQLQLKDRDATFLFFSLSVAFHDAGEPDLALALLRHSIEFAKAISGGLQQGKFLWGCASLLARWNYPEEAKAVAEGIKDELLRTHAIQEVKRSSA
jgi:hypothetical protein